MGVCPRCYAPIKSIEFYSQTGKFRMTGTLYQDGNATINFAGNASQKELGFYCPECGDLLTEEPRIAKNILNIPDLSAG